MASGVPTRGRSWLWAVLGSATFHVAVLIALVVAGSGWLAHRERVAKEDASASAGATAAEANSANDNPGMAPADDLADTDPQAMAQMLADRAADADAMDTDERVERLEAQAAWLADRSGEQVAAMAEKVTTFVGSATGRAMAPRAEMRDAPASEFVADTATLYDIAPRTEADGRTVYDWTLVDSEGRSLVVTYEAGDMTPQDLAAARVFATARDNPNLRTLVDAARSILAARPESQSVGEALGSKP